MKALGWACVITILALVGATLYTESRARQHRIAVETEIHNLAVSVEKLAINMERMLREQGALDSEPIVIVVGDPQIGDPITTEWRSGRDTIIVRVYKETPEESGDTQLRRSQEAVAKAVHDHPIN